MTTRSVATDANIEPQLFATVGQQGLLDLLRAEMGALQAIMPGLAARPTPGAKTPGQSLQHDDAFDNMPV